MLPDARVLSRLIRRTHMYLALVLAPWTVAYALSTLVMNHSWVPPTTFVLEREQTYDAVFPDGTPPQQIGAQVLADLGIDGAFNVQGPRPDGSMVITRQNLLAPRRITFTPDTRMLLVERMERRPNAFFERFHRRRGYATGYRLDTAWAVTVDAVIVAMMFWALSGLWMWWEMKVTRAFGALAFLGGVGLFAAYLVML